MTAYVRYVNHSTGSNSNNGSVGLPFATIRYATTTGVPATLSAGDTLTVYVVPGTTYDDNDDYIRIEAAKWTGGKLIVRSSIQGTPFITSPATPTNAIWMVGTADLELEVYDCDMTCTQVVAWASLTVDTNIGLRLTLDSSCIFRHVNTVAIDAFAFDSNALNSTLTIDGAAEFYGWASPFNSTRMVSVNIDGAYFDAESCLGDSSFLVGPSISITNTTFKWTNAVSNIFQLRSSGTLIFDDNIIEIRSTATAAGLQIMAPLSGETCSLSCKNNTIVATTTAPALLVGNNIVDASTRAVNDATAGIFAPGSLIENNSIRNADSDGGVLRMMIGTDDLIVKDNQLVYGLASELYTANPHGVYLYGDGIEFKNNNCSCQILAFGPNQVITNNVNIARIGILLGGTGGGSSAVGGGNNYTIKNNLLIATFEGALNDYAYNDAYPTNLGTLVADIDNNTYIALEGAEGTVRLTASGTYAETLTELTGLWEAWGASSNASNDVNSTLISDLAEIAFYQVILDEAISEGRAINTNDFVKLRAYFAAATSLTVLATRNGVLIYPTDAANILKASPPETTNTVISDEVLATRAGVLRYPEIAANYIAELASESTSSSSS
jgi:hypothetical protein